MSKASMDALAEEDARGKIERYHKGMHTCKRCDSPTFWLFGCEEYKDKVRSLLSKEVPNFKEGGSVGDYCPDCQWDKLGMGLNVEVVIRAARVGAEHPDQIVERTKSMLEGLSLPFTISGVERVHCRKEVEW